MSEAGERVREHTGKSNQPFQHVGNLYDSDSKLSDFHARGLRSVHGTIPPEGFDSRGGLGGSWKQYEMDIEEIL